MRAVLVPLLVLASVACALAGGLAAVLERNVIDPQGFARVVVRTVQSPDGTALVRGAVAAEVQARAADQPAILVDGAARVAGEWAAQAVASPAAVRIIGPAAIGLQQGLLAGQQDGRLRLDVRAFATAANPPPLVRSVLDAVPGDLLVEVPWVTVSPLLERVIRLLDRHPWLPVGLVAAAVALALAALALARRRGLVLVLLGALLAAGALLARPLAVEGADWLARADTTDEAVQALIPVAVAQVLDGWRAVAGAIAAIGAAIALVGLVLGVRRPRG